MKTTGKRKDTQRKLPYEKQKGARISAKESKSRPADRKTSTAVCQLPMSPAPSLPSASSSTSSSSPNPVSSSFPPLETARDLFLEFLHKTYPNITPRHEYDIVTLGTTRIPGTTEEVLAWVDEQMHYDIIDLGSREAVLENARRALEPVVAVTGRKPRDARDRAHVRPLPDSKYSIRLFPGNPYNNEYCMDIVDTATGQAVNSPFEFDLWAVPNPKAPWLSMPSGRLRSLERCMGIAQHDILPGEEKWLLRDGLTCLLKRPGKRDVQFTVPMRKQLQPLVYDVEILDFPEEE
ncbi:hypothetical protein C8Q70DRAFT_964071 [Cubamyces menziesii]|nr:hypothetical protein C8Q70DRAFT_964071 [Cubamyces menziesii]